MKRTLITMLLALCCFGAATAQEDYMSNLFRRDDVYSFRGKPADIYGRFTNPTPVICLFPDAKTDRLQAEAFLESSGLKALIDSTAGSVFFFNPLGDKYNNARDFEAYEGFVNRMRLFFNLKVVGIGNGATFVNETIARRAGNVAGIVSIDGKVPSSAKAGESPVPAYIAGKNAAKIATNYIKRDGARLVSKQGRKSLYVNPEEELMRVCVNTADTKDMAAVLADAWESVLSWNYRYNNYQHTWYTGESYGEHGDAELEPYIVFERLGLQRNVCIKNLTGAGAYLWYEYIPKACLEAADGTVPLVVLLHGNNNDPRTQAETSGFLPVASKEGFMVVEMEWQGNGWAVMGHDGIETVIYELFHKYPQLDRSRVYAEGLSAGAFNATALGIKKTHVFAAVGAQSGGVMPAIRFGAGQETLFDEARLKRGSCQMPYFSISGNADEVVTFPKPDQQYPSTIQLAWQAYQIINGLPVYETLDFGVDAEFGMPTVNRSRQGTNKGLFYEIGDQCNESGVPLIRIVSVDGYGHWNFAPGAQMMWDYFKLFSRDPETKKLIFHGN